MWHYLKEHGFAFKLGAAGSVGIWGSFLFVDISFIPNPVLAFILKVIGAATIAFVTGLATCLATDFYKDAKQWSKNKKPVRWLFKKCMALKKIIFNNLKNKNNDRKEQDRKDKAA
jgi:apolipoprotein N-acyltransferase